MSAFRRALWGACAAPTLGALGSVDDMVADWSVTVLDAGSPQKYRVAFEWEHVHESAVVVDYVEGSKVKNPGDDPRCSGSSSVVSPIDGQPFWMPRFISRPVPAQVTALTGIRFASVDWQPCGHKDITICHAESHYDIHFYYVDEADLAQMPMCGIGSPTNPSLPICLDSATNGANHDYFRLINRTIPISLATSAVGLPSGPPRNMNFCVDPSSAILRSGVHYGDKSETLEEWKTPVTIIGSHDCELKFFEPMVSWKWISDKVSGSTWPSYRVSNITYADKSAFPAIPTAWELEVSTGCRTTSLFATSTVGKCTMRLVIEGDACQAGEMCSPVGVKQCGEIADCMTNSPYKTVWMGGAATTTTTTAVAPEGGGAATGGAATSSGSTASSSSATVTLPQRVRGTSESAASTAGKEWSARLAVLACAACLASARL